MLEEMEEERNCELEAKEVLQQELELEYLEEMTDNEELAKEDLLEEDEESVKLVKEEKVKLED